MSITGTYYEPKCWSPAYNPIPWSVESNKNTEIDFSYVFDLYINGSATYDYRIKQRPNPLGIGMVDVSPIVQSYINLTDYSAESGWTKSFRDSSEIVAQLEVKVGEEYIGTDGALTIFDGLGATGEPNYTAPDFENNGQVRVLPSALDFQTERTIMAADYDYPFYSTYIMGGTGQFLKRDSNDITVREGEYHTLAFLNWNDLAAGSYASPVQGINVEYFGATGSISSTFYQNITTNGGGPQTSAAYVSAVRSQQYDMITFGCGPAQLTLPVGTTYYEVKAYYKATGTVSTAPNTVASETVTFTLSTECNDLYTPVRLSWLNDLGGRDYFTFDMKYEKSTSSTESEYYQSELNWSGLRPVVYDNGTNDTNENWQRGGNKSYNRNVTESFLIESNWLDQSKVDFLGYIAESPSVWAYIGTNPIPYTVKIDNPSYSYKLVKQEKLVQASFNLTYTKLQQKQNL